MGRKLKRWFGSKTGKNIIIAILGAMLVFSVLGNLFGTGGLSNFLSGTAAAPPGGYTCLPTCDVEDGRFLSMPGQNMDSFGGAKSVVWINVPKEYSSFEIGIFDGDSQKDETGAVGDYGTGHWDETDAEVTYTLYADPGRNGLTTMVIGQWHGNQDPMPDNDWYNITINTSPEAQSVTGAYYYRLEATRDDQSWGISAFKLRSNAYLSTGTSELFNASFAIVGMLGTPNDTPIIYPEFSGDYDNPGPSTYDGSWDFYFYVPEGETTLQIWDGDFDRGTSPDVAQDTDDPDTEGRPPWASDYAVPERAGGAGSPQDDTEWPIWRREPPVYYEIFDPSGNVVYSNDEPSGTEEWEQYAISADPNVLVPDEADLHVDALPSGWYHLKIIGLDLHNTVWLRTNYEIVPPCQDGPCEPPPPCPTCPVCETCIPCEETPVPPPPEPTPTPEPTPLPTPEPCPEGSPIDLLYVLDVSGSMNYLYPGPGTKLDAAKQAILALNDWVAQQNNGSRVALGIFHGAGQGQGHPPLYPPDVQLVSEFTTDINSFNEAVMNLDASGSTPTALALNLTAGWLPTNRDPNHIPVVILLSDGVPTVDLDQHGFQDQYVQEVDLFDENGNFVTPAQAREMGRYFGTYGEHAGEPVADAMEAIQNLKATLPEVQVYAVAVQAMEGGIFNDDILQYVASVGNGAFFTAENVDEMTVALQWAFVGSACGEEPPTGGGGQPPTGEPPCDEPRVNHYNVENPTNNPFYSIKFEYQSGTEVKNGDYDEFSFVLPADIAAAMDEVEIAAKAGRAVGQTTLSNCQFDQPEPCDTVAKRRFLFSFQGATDNGDGTLTLTFRVQNNRGRALSHVAIGLPEDVVPSWPSNTYESVVCP